VDRSYSFFLERERGALSLVANSFLAQEQVLGYVRRTSNMGTLISDLHTTTKEIKNKTKEIWSSQK
jgi:hypothetical protein